MYIYIYISNKNIYMIYIQCVYVSLCKYIGIKNIYFHIYKHIPYTSMYLCVQYIHLHFKDTSSSKFPYSKGKQKFQEIYIHSCSSRKEWQPTPVFLPGRSHGQRSLVGYHPWGCKESDTIEQLTLTNILINFLTLFLFGCSEYLLLCEGFLQLL